MPKEDFYYGDQVEGDGQGPDLTVAWGSSTPPPQVLINGCQVDRSGINRLIKVLRKARDQTFGEDS